MRREYMVLLMLNVADYYVRAENSNNSLATDQKQLDWWQTAVFYQIYPRSFKDSDGDGVGDIGGIVEKALHFQDIGVDCVWLSPIYKSPMADFGYDISDFRQIDSIFGSMDDFVLLKKKLDSLGIKLIMDFVPNHSSDAHEWFKKSVEKNDPYTDYYVWRDAKIDQNGSRAPPNNWQSFFGNSAWTWNEKRGQYYLHQYDPKQPDLNYRKNELIDEMKNILRFWLDLGVDGFRVDAVWVLFEDNAFLDEEKTTEEFDLKSKNTHDHYIHKYTIDMPETYDMVRQFREVLDEYKNKDGKTRFMATEAYTSIENTMRYFGNDTHPGAHTPFNFEMIVHLKNHAKATDFNDTINRWLKNMPKGKLANWVIGNHDKPRVATRFGAEMVDAMNMLNLLLPGTAFTYMGEEIGMQDTKIRWDQTVDPKGLNAGPAGYQILSRDPARTPYQWDGSVSSGFSVNSSTWLPVNPNYWTLNLEQQKNAQPDNSHYHVYKRLIELRKTPTVRDGAYNGYVVSEWVFAFSRSLEGSESYLVVINVGSQDEQVHLSGLPVVIGQKYNYVHVCSSNSQYSLGYNLTLDGFTMRPKSALVLSKYRVDVSDDFSKLIVAKLHSSSSSSSPLFVLPSTICLIILGCILANRF